jgi:hypothetical protein
VNSAYNIINFANQLTPREESSNLLNLNINLNAIQNIFSFAKKEEKPIPQQQ